MPSESQVAAVQSWIAARHDALLEDFRELLRIPSLEADAVPTGPFGQANRDALDFMLALGDKAGMATTDIEGYCGYAEFGTGDKMVMTLGHVDVVPVGPGWKHEPFGAEIDGDYVFARGASDDKGPTIAMFYAAWAVKECCPDLDVRIRSVFGCNEESGFACVHRYMETEEAPTLGVAPDAGWPCIHGEKGIANFVVDKQFPKGDLTVVRLEGGQRPNIVIDKCTAEVRVAAGYRTVVEGKIADNWDKNLEFAWHGDTLTLIATGKAAHGAWPHGGDNAGTRILRFLKDIAPLEQEREFSEWFEMPHIGGDGLGISGSDEPSGALTLNWGIVETVGESARMTLNVRYPVTWNGDDLRNKAEKFLGTRSGKASIFSFSDSPPLYFPIDHPLVKSVVDVYEIETGERKEPSTMGGGTYARAVPNCVAIGTGWEGDGPAHETDEKMKIAHLYKMAKIYGRLLLTLAEAAKAS